MPRSCFSPTRALRDTCFLPNNEYTPPKNEVKLGLTPGQLRWQRLSWLYFLYHLNNNSKPRDKRLPELDLAQKFYSKFASKKRIPKVAVSIIEQGDFLTWGLWYQNDAQLHHINPKRQALFQLWGYDPDADPKNIIPLQPTFHVGEWYNDPIATKIEDFNYATIQEYPFIHADMRVAWHQAHSIGWDKTMPLVFEHREKAIEEYGCYHNNSWDRMLQQISDERYYCFANVFSGFYYPQPNQNGGGWQQPIYF